MSSIEENFGNLLLGGLLVIFIVWVAGNILIFFEKRNQK